MPPEEETTSGEFYHRSGFGDENLPGSETRPIGAGSGQTELPEAPAEERESLPESEPNGGAGSRRAVSDGIGATSRPRIR